MYKLGLIVSSGETSSPKTTNWNGMIVTVSSGWNNQTFPVWMNGFCVKHWKAEPLYAVFRFMLPKWSYLVFLHSFHSIKFIYFNWRLITLQYCSGFFSHALTWVSHGCTCVPHPEPLCQLPPHPILQGCPRTTDLFIVSIVLPFLESYNRNHTA